MNLIEFASNIGAKGNKPFVYDIILCVVWVGHSTHSLTKLSECSFILTKRSINVWKP